MVPRRQKGDLRVDTLAINFDSPKIMAHWEEIMNRLNSGDMPPEDQPRPKPDEMRRRCRVDRGPTREADAARQSSGAEKVSFRKLSREEYANTISDLLGITFDVNDPTGLPEDPDWQGFQRIGSVLTLSPAHVEKYLAAAEMVLNEALSLGPQPKRELIRWTPFDLRWKSFEKEYQARGIADKVRIDLVPNNGALDQSSCNSRRRANTSCGRSSAGCAADGPAPRLRLYCGDLSRLVFEQDIDTPEDQPVTIEMRSPICRPATT